MGSSNLELKLVIKSDGTAAVKDLQGVEHEIGQVEASSKKAGDGASQMGELLKSAAKMAAAAWAASEVVGGIKSFIEAGIQANANMETSRIGIASLIVAQTDLKNSLDSSQGAARSMNTALAMGDDQLQKLRIAGLQTTATTEQLTVAFQAAVGAGLEAGLKLDDIRKLTVGITQAAGALNVPMDQLNQEITSILRGTIDQNSVIAKNLGISNEMVASWKAQGTLAKELEDRLKAFGVAGQMSMNTWTGTVSSMQEAFSLFSAQSTKGMFDTLTKTLNQSLNDFFDMETGTVSAKMQPLVGFLNDLFTAAGKTAAAVIEWMVKGLGEFSGWLGKGGGVLKDIGSSAYDIVSRIVDMGAEAASFVGYLFKMAGGMDTVNFAFKVADMAVAGLQDGVRFLSALFAEVSSAIVKNLTIPLLNVVAKIGDMIGWINADIGDFVGSSVRSLADGLTSMANSYHQYAGQVWNDFATGNTEVAKLSRTLDQSADSQRQLAVATQDTASAAQEAASIGSYAAQAVTASNVAAAQASIDATSATTQAVLDAAKIKVDANQAANAAVVESDVAAAQKIINLQSQIAKNSASTAGLSSSSDSGTPFGYTGKTYTVYTQAPASGNYGLANISYSANNPQTSSSMPLRGAFATGGSFLVDGNGGTDSQTVAFRATPGERVTVQTPEQQAQAGGHTFNIVVNGVQDARAFVQQVRDLLRVEPNLLLPASVRAG